MKDRLTSVGFCLLLTITTGCISAHSYPVKTQAAPAQNVYSSYQGKIPGRFVAIVDDVSLQGAKRTVKAASQACSLHTYPVDSITAIRDSIQATLLATFENIEVVASLPPLSDPRFASVNGSVVVRLDTFEPRLSCQMGQLSGMCTASVEVTLGVTVQGKTQRLFGASIGATSSVDGDSGHLCDNNAELLSRAIRQATRSSMEKMAEQLSNASRIRDSVSGPR